MKNYDSRKKEIIVHLNWCLEKMKYYERMLDNENYAQLYRDIFNLISAIDEMESKVACAYYQEKAVEGFLKQRLIEYRIELTV